MTSTYRSARRLGDLSQDSNKTDELLQQVLGKLGNHDDRVAKMERSFFNMEEKLKDSAMQALEDENQNFMSERDFMKEQLYRAIGHILVRVDDINHVGQSVLESKQEVKDFLADVREEVIGEIQAKIEHDLRLSQNDNVENMKILQSGIDNQFLKVNEELQSMRKAQEVHLASVKDEMVKAVKKSSKENKVRFESLKEQLKKLETTGVHDKGVVSPASEKAPEKAELETVVEREVSDEVNVDFVGMKKEFKDLTDELKSDVGDLKNDLKEMKKDFRSDTGELKLDIEEMKNVFKSEIGELVTDVQDMKYETHKSISNMNTEIDESMESRVETLREQLDLLNFNNNVGNETNSKTNDFSTELATVKDDIRMIMTTSTEGLSTKLESTRDAIEDVVLSKTKDLNSKLDLMKRELARSQRAAPERQQKTSSWVENQKGDIVMSEDINAKLDTLKVYIQGVGDVSEVHINHLRDDMIEIVDTSTKGIRAKLDKILSENIYEKSEMRLRGSEESAGRSNSGFITREVAQHTSSSGQTSRFDKDFQDELSQMVHSSNAKLDRLMSEFAHERAKEESWLGSVKDELVKSSAPSQEAIKELLTNLAEDVRDLQVETESYITGIKDDVSLALEHSTQKLAGKMDAVKTEVVHEVKVETELQVSAIKFEMNENILTSQDDVKEQLQILTGQIVEINDTQQQRFSVFGSEMAEIMDQTTRSFSTKFDAVPERRGGNDQDAINTEGLAGNFLSMEKKIEAMKSEIVSDIITASRKQRDNTTEEVKKSLQISNAEVKGKMEVFRSEISRDTERHVKKSEEEIVRVVKSEASDIQEHFAEISGNSILETSTSLAMFDPRPSVDKTVSHIPRPDRERLAEQTARGDKERTHTDIAEKDKVDRDVIGRERADKEMAEEEKRRATEERVRAERTSVDRQRSAEQTVREEMIQPQETPQAYASLDRESTNMFFRPAERPIERSREQERSEERSSRTRPAESGAPSFRDLGMRPSFMKEQERTEPYFNDQGKSLPFFKQASEPGQRGNSRDNGDKGRYKKKDYTRSSNPHDEIVFRL